MPTIFKLAVTALLSGHSALAAYNLVKTYSGSNFFDNWAYFGHYDNLTNGDIIWVNQTVGDDATNPLTYVNAAGNAIIKTDNQTTVPYNDKRNSVRLTSNDKVGLGSLIIFDVLHVPFGCSTWGALWTKAIGDAWPNGGEIDIFEMVNMQTNNQMALHTEVGCSQAANVSQTGTTGQTKCDNDGSNGAGCTVNDSSAASGGSAFAAAGGGVWVTELADTGINIWFFSRPDVPSSLSSDSVDVSTLGTPTASYPSSACNIAQFFTEQEIVIDITACGTYAGTASILQATCPALVGTNTCYTTYVLDPANYNNAYFEIASVKLLGTTPSAISTAAVSTSTNTGGGSNGNHGSGAAQRQTSGGLLAVVAGALGLTAALGMF